MSELDLVIENGVALVTLQAAERRNALTPDLARELIAALDTIDSDDAIGAVVIRGGGGSFCAGAHLGTLATADADPAGEEYGGLATSCLVGAAIGVLHRNRQLAANTALSIGGEVALSLAGVKLNVVGEHHLWSDRPAVFITNHQSNLDGLVIFKLLRRDFTSIAKKEIGQKPILAQFAWLINAALIDRADAGKAREAMAPAVERLAEGVSIVVAPEGTRSLTSRVGPFKKGPFHIAMQAGVPIVPIVVRNTGDLQWRGSKVIRAGEVDVAVLPPISVEAWDAAGLNERIAEIRTIYVDAMADWQSVVQRVGGTPHPSTHPVTAC